jgi:hypothetical protein
MRLLCSHGGEGVTCDHLEGMYCFRLHPICHAMAQVVSCWHVTVEAWVYAQVSPCGIQIGTGTGFCQSSSILLSLSFHWGSSYSYITWVMNNRPLVAAIHRHSLTPLT